MCWSNLGQACTAWRNRWPESLHRRGFTWPTVRRLSLLTIWHAWQSGQFLFVRTCCWAAVPIDGGVGTIDYETGEKQKRWSRCAYF